MNVVDFIRIICPELLTTSAGDAAALWYTPRHSTYAPTTAGTTIPNLQMQMNANAIGIISAAGKISIGNSPDPDNVSKFECHSSHKLITFILLSKERYRYFNEPNNDGLYTEYDILDNKITLLSSKDLMEKICLLKSKVNKLDKLK